MLYPHWSRPCSAQERENFSALNLLNQTTAYRISALGGLTPEFLDEIWDKALALSYPSGNEIISDNKK